MDLIFLFQEEGATPSLREYPSIFKWLAVIFVFGILFWRLGAHKFFSWKKGRRLKSIGIIIFHSFIISFGIAFLLEDKDGFKFFSNTLIVSLLVGGIIGGLFLIYKLIKDNKLISKERFYTFRFFFWPITIVAALYASYGFMENSFKESTSIIEILELTPIILSYLVPSFLTAIYTFAIILIPIFCITFPEIIPFNKGRIETKYREVSKPERDKDKEDAIEYFTKSIQIYPTANAFMERAEVRAYLAKFGSNHSKSAFYNNALDDYNSAIELGPKQAKYYFLRGKFKGWFFEDGEFEIAGEEVLQDFLSALKLSKKRTFSKYDRWDLNRLLGETYKKMDKKSEAIHFFEKAIKILPNKESVYKSLGKTKINAGNIKDGLEDMFVYFEKNKGISTTDVNFLFKIGKKFPEYQPRIKEKIEGLGKRKMDFS